MRERFQRFMYGRNGFDDLNRFLTFLLLALVIASFFFRPLIWGAAAVIVITYFRAFSKNLYKRQKENEAYIRFIEGIKGIFTGRRDSARRNAGYKIFRCPNCRQKIRIPKGKGKIEISCPTCRLKFIRRS